MRNKLLLVHNARLPRARQVAAELAHAARAQGAETWVVALGDQPEIQSRLAEADLAFALGGDGTILRVARLALPVGLPVVGVNLGELGFLAALSPDEAVPALPELIAGGGWIEERMTLEATVFPPDTSDQTLGPFPALNDALVGRGEFARVIHVKTYVNGTPFTTYVGDGLLVATPTGSTAYNMAAGGPILDPTLECMVLTPILPYLSFDHPIVLTPGAEVQLTVSTDTSAALTLDGQTDVPLADGSRVVVRSAATRARFLRIQPRSYYYATLTRRLRQDRFKLVPE